MKSSRICAYLIALAALSVAHGAAAATWFGINVSHDEALIFFDADTVERSSNSVTLWVKSVQLSTPDKNGAWSTAYRLKFNCSTRTRQTLAWSDYEDGGKFIRSNNTAGTVAPIYPDSIGEGMLKIVCAAGFPSSTSDEEYWKLFSNDVFEVRDAVVRGRNRSVDTAPK
ncbi:MAG: hypothetical protein Q8L72_00745 [Moraxellaceae bacterium]|nr:hypothetical protein [Moraxellaceae bacterium]